ncbi:MAG: hypothetical protein AABY22_17640 [Nanoarchaeota archaeon]
MDNRTNYSRLKKMIELIDSETLNLEELKGFIAIHIGSGPDTITNALKTLGMTGLITDIGNFRFKINK